MIKHSLKIQLAFRVAAGHKPVTIPAALDTMTQYQPLGGIIVTTHKLDRLAELGFDREIGFLSLLTWMDNLADAADYLLSVASINQDQTIKNLKSTCQLPENFSVKQWSLGGLRPPFTPLPC